MMDTENLFSTFNDKIEEPPVQNSTYKGKHYVLFGLLCIVVLAILAVVIIVTIVLTRTKEDELPWLDKTKIPETVHDPSLPVTVSDMLSHIKVCGWSDFKANNGIPQIKQGMCLVTPIIVADKKVYQTGYSSGVLKLLKMKNVSSDVHDFFSREQTMKALLVPHIVNKQKIHIMYVSAPQMKNQQTFDTLLLKAYEDVLMTYLQNISVCHSLALVPISMLDDLHETAETIRDRARITWKSLIEFMYLKFRAPEHRLTLLSKPIELRVLDDRDSGTIYESVQTKYVLALSLPKNQKIADIQQFLNSL